jgi:hypothetical protein
MPSKNITPKSLQGIGGQPETAEELINKYGTYEIQPTADADNLFPTIAAELPTSLKSRAAGKRNKPFAKGQNNNKTE